MTKRVLWFLALLALVVAAASCGGDDDEGAATGTGTTENDDGGEVVKGGILRIGTTGEIDSINPFVAFNSESYQAFVVEYPLLVQYSTDFEWEGDWADSWETSEDGLTWTFHLKPGEWSDGTPLTAEDAVWTGETVLKYADGPTAILAPFLTNVTSLTAPDPQTLVIEYATPVGQRAPAAPAVLHPPEARLGAARRRRRQGAEAVQPAGRPAGRRRRPLHHHRVRREGHDDLREEPRLLRAGAERGRDRLPALRERGRTPHRLPGRRARLRRGGAAERGRDARGERRPRRQQGRVDRHEELHLQLEPGQAREPRAARSAGARGVRIRDEPRRDRRGRLARRRDPGGEHCRPADRRVDELRDPTASVRPGRGEPASSTSWATRAARTAFASPTGTRWSTR